MGANRPPATTGDQANGGSSPPRRPTRVVRARQGLLATALAVALLSLAACAPPPPPLTLGTLTIQSGTIDRCPPGSACQPFTVHCPQLRSDARGVFAVGEPDPGAAYRGTVMFFGGGAGVAFWSDVGGDLSAGMQAGLRHDGFRTVDVRWVDSWRVANPGERAGYAKIACRPSTAIQWVHDHLYQPAPTSGSPGHCGFCVTGNSDGGSQAAYALAFYGLSPIVDAIVPTSGPPMAAQEKGCTDVPGYPYKNATDRHWVDEAYGYVDDDGPCATHGQGFDFGPTWTANSVDTGGNDYEYPRTRVHLIWGRHDTSNMPRHGQDYEAALHAHGSPMVSSEVVEDMAHPVQESADGLAALTAALEA